MTTAGSSAGHQPSHDPRVPSPRETIARGLGWRECASVAPRAQALEMFHVQAKTSGGRPIAAVRALGLRENVLIECDISRCMKKLLLVIAALVVLLTLQNSDQPGRTVVRVRRPNFVLVLTDDQVVRTLQKMPHVQRLMRRGTAFRRSFVSNSLCCPSRSTILTGLYSGHTGVWTNVPGVRTHRGGWQAFTSRGVNRDGSLFAGNGDNEERTVSLYLQQQGGYETGLFGKYLNEYQTDRPDTAPPVPVGWSAWHSFVGGNGAYYDYRTSDEGIIHHHGRSHWAYSTDVFGRKALAFLRSPQIQDGSAPFFLYFAPFAPHGPATPGPLDGDVRAPGSFMTPAFNEKDVSDKPLYVRRRELMPPAQIDRVGQAWDRAYGTLADVDRWLGRFKRALPLSVRRHTVFIFTSDNGYEWGDHRLNYKVYPYERSVRVPLVIAGPGIVHQSTKHLVTNADLTPTILDLAGLSGTGGPFDGRSLVPVLTATGSPAPRARLLLEHLVGHETPSFCGLRTRRWKYVVYRGGFQELYDLRKDPFELHNVARVKGPVRDRLRHQTERSCDPPPPGWNPAVWTRLDG